MLAYPEGRQDLLSGLMEILESGEESCDEGESCELRDNSSFRDHFSIFHECYLEGHHIIWCGEHLGCCLAHLATFQALHEK